MKKAVLKTILRDFFKLRYPVAFIIVIILIGAGIILAGGFGSINTGYRLNHNTPSYPITSIRGGAIVSNSSAVSDYFVPTKLTPGWSSFVQNCPATVTVIPATTPAGQYYDHSLRCTDANITCPADYYCVGYGYKSACPSGETSPAGSTSFWACTPPVNTPPASCVPDSSCVSADCGVDNCGNACGPVCNSGYFCNNHHRCQLNL